MGAASMASSIEKSCDHSVVGTSVIFASSPLSGRVRASSAPKAPALPTSIERKGLKAGSIIRLDKVYFEANQFTLKAESLNALEEVFNFLHDNPDVSVEVGGHTNNNPTDDFANNLSTNRAKAVADWLIKRGIPAGRVKYKGYGKKMPIAQNTTPEGRKLNQRVEIKILSING